MSYGKKKVVQSAATMQQLQLLRYCYIEHTGSFCAAVEVYFIAFFLESLYKWFVLDFRLGLDTPLGTTTLQNLYGTSLQQLYSSSIAQLLTLYHHKNQSKSIFVISVFKAISKC